MLFSTTNPKAFANGAESKNNFDNIYVKETLPKKNNERFITDSICFNVCRLAQRVEAKAIITMTHSGYTAYKISSSSRIAFQSSLLQKADLKTRHI